MLYINSNERKSIETFRLVLYNHIKENRLRYSDQRERVLKILYAQHYPVSVDYLVKKLNEHSSGAGYATVSRHIKFFQKLDMLIIINKTPKGYLLKRSTDSSDVEVVNHEFKSTQ